MVASVENSPDLHAFPDHEVMQWCLEGVRDRRLSKEEAVRTLESDAGWMPVSVEPEDGLIYFANVGERSLSRWQFVYSIKALAADDPPLKSFSVDFSVLEDLQPG